MSRPARRHRLLAGAAVLAALTAGCGLKPDATSSLRSNAAVGGVAAPAAGAGAGAGAGAASAAGGSAGSAAVAAGGASGALPGASTGGAAGAGGAASSGAGAPTAGATGPGTGARSGGSTGGAKVGTTAPAAGGACGTPHGGTTTGVTGTTINIGLHAPLTGTGTPFPNSSFQAGAGTFWQQPGHTVCGRKVNVEFKDDTYTPAGARNVCSDMAKRDFLVVGGGGTDQIQACATDPDIQRLGVPYLSAGVTDNGLRTLSNYFAVSLTYQQQGVLVLKNAQAQGIATPSPSSVNSDNIQGKKAVWAIVTGGSANFAGARDGIESALTAAGIPYKDYQVDQNGNYQSAATQFGSQLALNGFKTIFVDAAPGYFVFMSGGYYGANSVNTPNWVGPGVTYTEVTVAQYICTASHGAINGHAWFLAPAPGIDHATQDFKTAYKGKYDDIEWTLWGLSETIWQLFQDASANLTRQNFIAASERAVIPSRVYPPVDYRDHGGHFGGTGAWVQRVNCGQTEPDQNQPGSWNTIGDNYLSLY